MNDYSKLLETLKVESESLEKENTIYNKKIYDISICSHEMETYVSENDNAQIVLNITKNELDSDKKSGTTDTRRGLFIFSCILAIGTKLVNGKGGIEVGATLTVLSFFIAPFVNNFLRSRRLNKEIDTYEKRLDEISEKYGNISAEELRYKNNLWSLRANVLNKQIRYTEENIENFNNVLNEISKNFNNEEYIVNLNGNDNSLKKSSLNTNFWYMCNEVKRMRAINLELTFSQDELKNKFNTQNNIELTNETASIINKDIKRIQKLIDSNNKVIEEYTQLILKSSSNDFDQITLNEYMNRNNKNGYPFKYKPFYYNK